MQLLCSIPVFFLLLSQLYQRVYVFGIGFVQHLCIHKVCFLYSVFCIVYCVYSGIMALLALRCRIAELTFETRYICGVAYCFVGQKVDSKAHNVVWGGLSKVARGCHLKLLVIDTHAIFAQTHDLQIYILYINVLRIIRDQTDPIYIAPNQIFYYLS